LAFNFNIDRWAVSVLAIMALVLAGWRWLADHPEHNPWAPLNISDPPGWATGRKLARLRDEPDECQAFLRRSGVGFTALPPIGEGACRRTDRTVLAPDAARDLVLRPGRAAATCAVNAGLALWLRHGVQPASEKHLGSRVVALEHYGTNNCRRIGGNETAGWSEHATGNAIDIAAFVLADGRRIKIRSDWSNQGSASDFLRDARNAGCGIFGTLLSPEYNAAHADHFHIDQAGSRRGWSFCR
jgi:hypothetical protein